MMLLNVFAGCVSEGCIFGWVKCTNDYEHICIFFSHSDGHLK